MKKHHSLSSALIASLIAFNILSPDAVAQTTAPNEWTWMGGSSSMSLMPDSLYGQSGVYGTLGVPDAENIPGSRYGASSWTDKSDNLWLFSGYGYDSNGNSGNLNDLWEFNPNTNEWAWIEGISTFPYGGFCQSGVYGKLGTFAAGNIPGSRNTSISWTDSRGNFWLFGGIGCDSSGNFGYLNDLWEFDPTTKEWAWVSGSNTMSCGTNGCGRPGVYGTLNTPDNGNYPGGRSEASRWTDENDDLWIFGGLGYDASGNLGFLNDVWEFNPSISEWAWMGGSNSMILMSDNQYGQPGVYGSLEMAAGGNIPGGRSDASSWSDKSGNLWLFGGVGYDAGSTFDELNDLWEFSPATNEWAWMGGSSTVSSTGGQLGIYGTLGTPAAGNLPGSRYGSLNWVDSSGYFWLFGGYGYDSSNGGWLNDMWVFNPSANEWAWMGGSSSMSCGVNGCYQSGMYGTLESPDAANIPGSRGDASSWIDSSGFFWLFGGIGADANGNLGKLNDLWVYQPLAPFVQMAATPAFSPVGGTYTASQAVSISDATSGATIYYTTDGTTPQTNSTVYSGAITVSSTQTLEAIAVASGYTTSAVATAAYTINLPPLPPDFTVSLSPSWINVTPGQSGTTTITVMGVNGFNSNVSFACSGLPAGAACTFSLLTEPTPANITNTTLTLTTSATTVHLQRNSSSLFPAPALAIALCCIGLKKRRYLQRVLLLAVGIFGLALITGCGTPGFLPTTSVVTLTATSGSLQHSTTFLLTVL